jgi:catechol-2,3-dioxygenase
MAPRTGGVLLGAAAEEPTMPITRLNHAVLYVRDVERSVEFYSTVLGFSRVEELSGIRGAAFLRAPASTNDHDLGLFEIGSGAGASGAGRGAVGLYHLAWEVDTLGELERLAGALSARGALVGATDHTTTKSLYGHDPDGLEFEVAWVVPADRLAEARATAGSGPALRPLDLAAEKERFGADTRGGIGVSVPA